MKKFSSLLSLLVIASVSTGSVLLYLDQHYNMSALLTLCWIISIALWIHSKGGADNKHTAH